MELAGGGAFICKAVIRPPDCTRSRQSSMVCYRDEAEKHGQLAIGSDDEACTFR
jgi:hypothetical protein